MTDKQFQIIKKLWKILDENQGESGNTIRKEVKDAFPDELDREILNKMEVGDLMRVRLVQILEILP